MLPPSLLHMVFSSSWVLSTKLLCYSEVVTVNLFVFEVVEK